MSFASQATILPAFATHLGASNLVIGAIPAVMTLGWFLPSLFVAPHTESLPRKLPFMLRYTLWERLPLPALAAVAFFVADPLPRLALALVLPAAPPDDGRRGRPDAGLDGRHRPDDPDDPPRPLLRRRERARQRRWAPGERGDGLPPRRLSGAGELRPVLPRAARSFSRSRTSHWPPRASRWPLPPGRSCRWPPISVASRRCSARDRNLFWFLVLRGAATLGGMGNGFYTVHALRTYAAPEWQVGVFTTLHLGGQLIGNLALGLLADRVGHRAVLVLGIGALVGATSSP